jgi:periplasmic protein TonB
VAIVTVHSRRTLYVVKNQRSLTVGFRLVNKAQSFNRLLGFPLVVLLHGVFLYALVYGLSRSNVAPVHAPIEVRIIEEQKPQTVAPPPPPPTFVKPVAPFVPPPEVVIATPQPVLNTAPVVTTLVDPPAAQTPVTVQPKIDLAHSRKPEYPAMSRRLHEEGSLVMQVLIDVDGKLLDEKIIESSGIERLDQAALSGIKSSYRFIPGTVGGKPQQMWYSFKFTWKLEQ